MTQRLTVLAMLRAAGERGVTSSEFLGVRVPRYGARLLELRTEGFVIETERIRDGLWRYTLVHDPTAAVVGGGGSPPSREVAAATADQDTLFAPPTAPAPHWMDDAA